MPEPEPIAKAELFARLPRPWPDESLPRQIAAHLAASRQCVVALDDDPTGTQTVHDVWVVTHWRVDDLRRALAAGEPAMYVLTNTRSLPLGEAQARVSEIAKNLLVAAREVNRPLIVVSRSDSTLRGHFPGETDALARALGDPPFDGVCLIPFFAEGGRYTVEDVHWVEQGGKLVPAAQSAYARDAVFGYRASHLPAWVEEKAGGRIRAAQVVSLSLELIRGGGPEAVAARLRRVTGGQVVVVNAADDQDLNVFVRGVQLAEGKRFLFRTAASFVRAAAGLAATPLLTAQGLLGQRPAGGGLTVFGSHVPMSSAQLAAARQLPLLEAVELRVPDVLQATQRRTAVAEAARRLNAALAEGRDAVVFTSRELARGADPAADLSISQAVSAALMETVGLVHTEPRYIIGKGGITSSDLAVHGLGMRAARVLGQVLPGVPVWQSGAGSRWPGLPLIVFPGNVGHEQSVADLITGFRAASMRR